MGFINLSTLQSQSFLMDEYMLYMEVLLIPKKEEHLQLQV